MLQLMKWIKIHVRLSMGVQHEQMFSISTQQRKEECLYKYNIYVWLILANFDKLAHKFLCQSMVTVMVTQNTYIMTIMVMMMMIIMIKILAKITDDSMFRKIFRQSLRTDGSLCVLEWWTTLVAVKRFFSSLCDGVRLALVTITLDNVQIEVCLKILKRKQKRRFSAEKAKIYFYVAHTKIILSAKENVDKFASLNSVKWRRLS